MSTITKYTPEEAILIGRAGIIAGVLGIISAVSPAIDMVENGVVASNLFSFSVSFFGFIPFAVICGIYWERRCGEDKLNTPPARLFVFSVCALGAAFLLFGLLWLSGAMLVGATIIIIAVIVAWWQWPRLPKALGGDLHK
ncbi:hypothetical protein [Roseicyclus sp.]|jgi:hypothetical protein